MIVSITSIKLRKWWYFFRLTIHGAKIQNQLRKEKGFVKMKNTGWGYDHYTLSLWETEEDIRRFYKEGAHLEAMKIGKEIAVEVRTLHYNSEKTPDWKEVRALLLEKGRITQYK